MDETATRDEPLRPARQVDVLPVFAEERAALLAVLAGLTSTEWEAATTCPGWTVRDLAAHLLGDDLGVLSRGRDGYAAPSARVEAGDRRWHDIVASLNELNERWVRATRHLSGPVLTELLDVSGDLVHRYFGSLDPDELGDRVSWAGPDPSPHWLNVAREYTERWVHQAQIRRAAHLSPLDEPRFLSPVIATFAVALPHAYSGQDADDGTRVTVAVRGEAGGRWTLVHTGTGWRLYEGEAAHPAALIELDQEAFWRHLARDDRSGIRERARASGRPELAEPFYGAVAVIAE